MGNPKTASYCATGSRKERRFKGASRSKREHSWPHPNGGGHGEDGKRKSGREGGDTRQASQEVPGRGGKKIHDRTRPVFT